VVTSRFSASMYLSSIGRALIATFCNGIVPKRLAYFDPFFRSIVTITPLMPAPASRAASLPAA